MGYEKRFCCIKLFRALSWWGSYLQLMVSMFVVYVDNSRREKKVEDCGEHFYGPGLALVYTSAPDQNLNHMSKPTPREATKCSLALRLKGKGNKSGCS